MTPHIFGAAFSLILLLLLVRIEILKHRQAQTRRLLAIEVRRGWRRRG